MQEVFQSGAGDIPVWCRMYFSLVLEVFQSGARGISILPF